VDPELDVTVRRSQAHLDLALQAARQSMTLLKNDDHLLPLSKTLKRIAVIGPNANVARYGDYSDPTEGERISMLTGIKEILLDATIVFDDGKDIPTAVAKAKDAEVAILGLGEWQGLSGEGFDRSNLNLPGNQEALLKAIAATGTPVVLVLQNGRPLTIDWAAQHIPAILEAWYPAEFGGRAIAETLFGDNNPAGRLTITFPQTVGQLPDYYDYDPSKKLDYVDCNGKALFPFGYGLSYTTFKYERLTVKPPTVGNKSDVIITVDVTNTGGIPGDEVVQLYVRENVATVETPVKSLKGFSRVHLKSDETRTVTFHLPQDQLTVWNRRKQWAFEPGGFTLWVGGSSDTKLSTGFTIAR
jgi:beta-glucosidase